MKNNESHDEKGLLSDVLGSKINIPPQPDIVLEIDRLLAKPNNTLNAIASLISKDVSLSGGLFRLANSPFYKSPGKSASLQQAITILGMGQVTNLIKGLALRRAIGGQELAYEKFWERSEEIAMLSGIIAGKQVSSCNISADQAYMAGLFHECGVPILMQHFPEYCQAFRLNQGSNWPNFREEDRHFRTDHTVVGFLVTRHWNLPEFICQAVRFHHDRLSVDHAALTMVSILQMARHLHKRIHHFPDNDWRDMQKQVLQEIGVSEEGAPEFMEDVIETFMQK